MSNLVRHGKVEQKWTARGTVSSYSIELWHDGLGEHRQLRAAEHHVLQNKVAALLLQWEKKWDAAQARAAQAASAESAQAETVEAQRVLAECEALLACSLDAVAPLNWEQFMDRTEFVSDLPRLPELTYAANGRPTAARPVPAPALATAGPAPRPEAFAAQLTMWQKLNGSARRKAEAAAAAAYEHAARTHATATEAARNDYDRSVLAAKAETARREEVLEAEEGRYASAAAEFASRQEALNEEVDSLRDAWHKHESAAVLAHAELVLATGASYPAWFTQENVISYDPEARALVVDFRLPAPAELPTLEKVTFVKARNERNEKHIAKSRAEKIYGSVGYQIAIRTLNELFVADEVDAYTSITFNGWVEATNPATGVLERGCILSVRAFKDEFLALNLHNVDPKACFRQLKGVAASSLAGLAAVRPVLQLATNDSRFIDAREVAGQLNDSVNLAAMDWEDFEHLVRELFSQVFAAPGSEVHVTQASRDGGVDAIAFDPDPIKGGKIVIQAKRYTNPVSVSAVRDLFGTVVNEGANRGILVTTSSFGPDAYKFAQGKPLTLLDGSNLLALLADHGHRARIDIAEARQLLDGRS